MKTIQNLQHSDTIVLQMHTHNNETTWAHLYDTYAPMMYGTILKMTGNETIAEEILEETFLELKEKKMFLGVQVNLCNRFMQHTYRITLKYLKERNLKPISIHPFNENYPNINGLCFEGSTSTEVATNSAITEQEVRRNIRAEFNALRNQRK